MAATAPPNVAPPPGHPRFPLFDALRAIAALGVLVSHAGYFSGASQDAWYGPLVAPGTVGVTVFFVISGFLLYRPFLAAELDGLAPIRVRDFARRRVLRIVPAYWLALTALAVYPGLVGVFSGDFYWYYGLLQVYGPDPTPVSGLAAAWSLCIEVSFYAYLPFHAAAMRRFGRGMDRSARLRRELLVLAGLAAASVALRAISLGSGGTFLELTLAGTFLWFALGMALAVVSVGGPLRGPVTGALARRPGACWLGAGALYLLLAAVLTTDDDGILRYSQGQWLTQHVVSGALAALLVAPAALAAAGAGLPGRVLRLPVLAWLGLISYGIYLWQGGWVLEMWRQGARDWVPGAPFLVMTATTLAGTVACAALSFYLLERPLMRWKDRPPLSRRARRRTADGAASARAPEPRTAPGSPR